MKFNIKRIIAFVFLIFSILYIIFGFSIERRRMIGDQQGWDPGSRAIPIGMGLLMLFVSLYIVVFKKEKEAVEKKSPSDNASRRLVILAIAISILYILLFRRAGFVVMTVFLLFTLIYFSYRRDVKWAYISEYIYGFIVSEIFIIFIYSMGRYITRFLIRSGRENKIGFLSNRLFTSAVIVILISLIFFLLILLKRRVSAKTSAERIPNDSNSRADWMPGDMARVSGDADESAGYSIAGKQVKRKTGNYLFVSVLTATAVTEFLYIVFKQIFWVSLAKGIIFW